MIALNNREVCCPGCCDLRRQHDSCRGRGGCSHLVQREVALCPNTFKSKFVFIRSVPKTTSQSPLYNYPACLFQNSVKRELFSFYFVSSHETWPSCINAVSQRCAVLCEQILQSSGFTRGRGTDQKNAVPQLGRTSGYLRLQT